MIRPAFREEARLCATGDGNFPERTGGATKVWPGWVTRSRGCGQSGHRKAASTLLAERGPGLLECLIAARKAFTPGQGKCAGLADVYIE